MKKALKIFLIVFVAAILVAQFVRPEMQNLPVNASDTLEATTEVPENVKSLLRVSCGDCHTNQTVFPWYSKITPVSWWLAGHINEGRRKLNFSVWRTYDASRRARKLAEVCENVESREMPLPSYLWGHWSAKPSADDIKMLCEWTKTERARIEAESKRSQDK